MKPCLLISVLLLFLVACSGSANSAAIEGTGFLSIRATDAPLDHNMVSHAIVHIDKVRVHVDSAAESGFVTLYEGAPLVMDLMDLRNGITRLLVNSELAVGEYRQIRLHVESASIELTNGNIYTTDDDSLRLNSQATSGFEVFVDPPIAMVSGLTSELLLDIDLSKTFRPVPANDPMNATTFRLHPVIRVANLTESGELRGVIFEDDTLGSLVTVGNASVYVMPPGETDTANSVASTASNANGAYAILGVPAGIYDVMVVKDLLTGREHAVTFTAGNLSTVDVVIQ